MPAPYRWQVGADPEGGTRYGVLLLARRPVAQVELVGGTWELSHGDGTIVRDGIPGPRLQGVLRVFVGLDAPEQPPATAALDWQAQLPQQVEGGP